MGTVHSLPARAASPGQLRQRFDRAFPMPAGRGDDSQEFPEAWLVAVVGGVFFLPLSFVGQLADNALREASLLWISLSRQQLCFFCPTP